MAKATHQTAFLFDTALKTQLTAILHREGTTLTAWIHDQAREYVQRHGAGNPAVPLDKFLANPLYRACPTLLEMEGRDWDLDSQAELLRYEQIINRERPRIYSARRKKEEH